MTKIHNVIRREDALPLKRVIESVTTSLDLSVAICPAGGSFDVVVSSPHPVPPEQIRAAVMEILAEKICDMG